jgi:hypothetical protein
MRFGQHLNLPLHRFTDHCYRWCQQRSRRASMPRAVRPTPTAQASTRRCFADSSGGYRRARRAFLPHAARSRRSRSARRRSRARSAPAPGDDALGNVLDGHDHAGQLRMQQRGANAAVEADDPTCGKLVRTWMVLDAVDGRAGWPRGARRYCSPGNQTEPGNVVTVPPRVNGKKG